MKHGIGRAAHRNIKRHGIFERLERCDAARGRTDVFFFIVTTGKLDRRAGRFKEQFLTRTMRCQHRAITRKSQTKCLGQTVHRVGGKHARARPAGRAGRSFNNAKLFVRDIRISGFDHGIDKVKMTFFTFDGNLAGLHRATGNKYRRNVQAHCRHQHTGRDLVTVGNANHGIGAMGIDHIFNGISNDFA